jgi:ferredoxin
MKLQRFFTTGIIALALTIVNVHGGTAQTAAAKKNDSSKHVALINQTKCIKCGTCFKNCPVKAISKIEKDKKVTYVIDPKKCIACGACVKNCPVKAISLVPESSTVPAAGDSTKKKVVEASTDSTKTQVKTEPPATK